MWRSLVARVVRDDEVAGSNPVIPTSQKPRSLLLVSGAFVCSDFVQRTLIFFVYESGRSLELLYQVLHASMDVVADQVHAFFTFDAAL